MKKYFQKIPNGVSVENPTNFQRARRVRHDKPLTKHQTKLMKLRKWLFDNHGVYSFTKLKQRGEKLTTIRKEGLAYAGF